MCRVAKKGSQRGPFYLILCLAQGGGRCSINRASDLGAAGAPDVRTFGSIRGELASGQTHEVRGTEGDGHPTSVARTGRRSILSGPLSRIPALCGTRASLIACASGLKSLPVPRARPALGRIVSENPILRALSCATKMAWQENNSEL